MVTKPPSPLARSRLAPVKDRDQPESPTGEPVGASRLAVDEGDSRVSGKPESTVRPAESTTRPARSASPFLDTLEQREVKSCHPNRTDGFTDPPFAPPPQLDEKLLYAVLEGGQSILTLFVATSQLASFCRHGEPYESFLKRFRIQSEVLRRAELMPGPMQSLTNRLTSSAGWSKLQQALSDSQAYEELVVEVLSRQELRARQERLKNEVKGLFKGDLLTLVQQQVIAELGFSLGLESSEVREAMAEAVGTLRESGSSGLLEEGEPLARRRSHDPTPLTRSLLDLTILAKRHLGRALEELIEAIEKERMLLWLQARNLRHHPVWEAAERAQSRYDAFFEAGREQEPSFRTTLSQGAWDILWASGVGWLDLSWSDGRSDSEHLALLVPNPHGLVELVEQRGIEVLRNSISAAILSSWLRRAQPKLSDENQKGSLEWALLAEDRTHLEGFDSAESQRATWCFAWSLGVLGLRLDEQRAVRSPEELCQLDPRDPALLESALLGVLEDWIELRHQLPEVATRMKELGPLDPGGARRTCLAQWSLGRTSFEGGAFAPQAPEAAEILRAAESSAQALYGFGVMLADGWIESWVNTTLGDLLTEPIKRLLALSGTSRDRYLLAQRGREALGRRDLLVFARATESDPDPQPPSTRFANLAQLVEGAHQHWRWLANKEMLPTLRSWMAATNALEPSALLGDDLQELLWSAGDTTIRQGSGVPLWRSECESDCSLQSESSCTSRPDESDKRASSPEHAQAPGQRSSQAPQDERARFGGIEVKADLALEGLLAWISASSEAPPEPVSRAWEDGILTGWLSWHGLLPTNSLPNWMHNHESREVRYQAFLWSLGYEKLIIDKNCAVADATELIDRARDNLASVERLFDWGLLRSWAKEKAAVELERLEHQVERAQQELLQSYMQDRWLEAESEQWIGDGLRLARRSLSKTTNLLKKLAIERADPRRDMERLYEHTESWLLFFDRAALAVAAFGGRLDSWRGQGRKQKIVGWPPDKELELPIQLELLELGEIPRQLMLRSPQDSVGMAKRVDPANGQSLSLTLDEQLNRRNRKRFVEELELVWIGDDNRLLCEPITLVVKRGFDRNKFRLALRQGTKAAVFLAPSLGSVLPWLTWQSGNGSVLQTAILSYTTTVLLCWSIAFQRHRFSGLAFICALLVLLAALGAFSASSLLS